jgi:hypothetical protein
LQDAFRPLHNFPGLQLFSERGIGVFEAGQFDFRSD